MAVRVGGDIVGRIEVEEVKLETTQKEFLFRISYDVMNDLRYVSVFFNLSYYGALVAFGDKTEELNDEFKKLIKTLEQLLKKAEKFVKNLRKEADEDTIKKDACSLRTNFESVLKEIKKILKIFENHCHQPEEKVRSITGDIRKRCESDSDGKDYYYSFAKKLEAIKEVQIQVTTIAAFKCFDLCMDNLSDQVKSLAEFKDDTFKFPFMKLGNLTWVVLINVNITAIEALCSSLCNIQIIRENKGFECKLYCLMDRFLNYQPDPPMYLPDPPIESLRSTSSRIDDVTDSEVVFSLPAPPDPPVQREEPEIIM
uniref:Uncharacterized protein n=1 Tax=Amphimedon queenslandica TaxID=400682 RepID=A0A1X7VVJ7_AMPQE